jgi:ubiquinone/menaquinone biosynthesis C-methylase UbiE
MKPKAPKSELLPGSGPEISVQFARFAPYYDRFMVRYVNYPSWVRYVQRLFARHHRKPKLILDVACGSGLPTMLFARQGYRIIGVDRSEAMLKILQDKIGDLDIRTIHSDIRDFELPEPADAAVSLYDSINYLLTPDDMKRCFQAVYRNLMPNGIFIFDMNTIYGLAAFWGNRTTVRDVEDIHTIWHTTYDVDTHISILHLTFYVSESKHLVRYDEIHEERGYRIGEIESCLRAAGFRKADFYQHGGFGPPGPEATRIMIVAEK